MTNKEILKKAIEKAVKNGWDILDWYLEIDDPERERLKKENDWEWLVSFLASEQELKSGLTASMIFSHDFAKAFWGKKPFQLKYKTKIPWKYHLQQMVLEEEPIKYLEQFLQ